MKILIIALLQVVALLFIEKGALADDKLSAEASCAQSVVQLRYSSGACSLPLETLFTPSQIHTPLLPNPNDLTEVIAVHPTLPAKAEQPLISDSKTIVYFFWGKGCPHCEEERAFLDRLKSEQPLVEIRAYEVWYNRENAALMAGMLKAWGSRSAAVPVTFVGKRMFAGFNSRTKNEIEGEIKRCRLATCIDPAAALEKPVSWQSDPGSRTFKALSAAASAGENKEIPVNLPLLGDVNIGNSPLPLLTVIIAAMDSFNPCAFFVLLTLLGMLVHARSRSRMLLVGGIFVFFSGAIYFLFMAAWLNLFLLMGHLAAVTTVAGCVALLIAAINIKDFFFRQGISLTIADSAKPKLFERMRRLLRADSLASLLAGATLLAVVANIYELLCTAGFPMVFTRILTLSSLSTAACYLYLLLYNIVYVLPLFIIVLGFSLTLGKRKLSEREGRLLKLMSGVMMLGLGLILLIKPALLNSPLASLTIFLSAVGVSLLIAMFTKK